MGTGGYRRVQWVQAGTVGTGGYTRVYAGTVGTGGHSGTHGVRLARLLDVVRGDDDGLVGGAGDAHEVRPDGLAQQRVHAHRGLVQDQQLGVVHQRHRERHAP